MRRTAQTQIQSKRSWLVLAEFARAVHSLVAVHSINMAALAPLPEAYRMLKEMFGSLDENMVRKVYEDYKNHANPFDAAVSELLTLAAVQQDQQEKAKDVSEDAPASVGAPTIEAIAQVKNMFPDLSRSVIGGALFQNQGQAQGAIELLLDIGEDQDAIAQIRDMNPEKKAQVRQKGPIRMSSSSHFVSIPTIFSFLFFGPPPTYYEPQSPSTCYSENCLLDNVADTMNYV